MKKKLLIDLFGSESAIANALGHSRQRVHNWSEIPKKDRTKMKQKLRTRIKFLERKIEEGKKILTGDKS